MEVNQLKQQVGRSSHLVTRVAVADPGKGPGFWCFFIVSDNYINDLH